ncbi:MAG: T9SS type A sorting domain-containing protein [Lewinellaceae bacterium]|nr:T9SS type A sorting domain-containing protein [Saprospiraceae bacterium]MCB9340713.1 T9SS type A sorting domain-containing protein [Lewinellaceae bacterium]
MKKINTLTILLTLLLSVSLAAQSVTLKTPEMIVQPQETFKLKVQVEDFKDVVAAQFALYWDSNVLQFKGLQDFGLPDMVANEPTFSLMSVSEGKLRFSWNDLLATGVSVADMSTLFSINFKVIGPLYSNSVIQIAGDSIPTYFPIEIATNNGILDVDISTGNVLVGGVNATTESVTEDFTLYQNSPNPFTDVTYITFNLNSSTQAQLSIYDNAGRVIFDQNAMFAAGKHSIPVKREMFQSSGAYFFTLKTQNATATRQLIAH